MNSKNVFSSLISITFLVLLGFGILQFLNIPKDTMIDWVIGLSTAWSLLIIVIVPWNMYFSAKELLADVSISEKREIKINKEHIVYVEKIARRYLFLAIGFHICMAIGLALLAFYNITDFGYWGSGLALLLMALRPAIRLQAYVAERLSLIRNEVYVPREDSYQFSAEIKELKIELEDQKSKIEELTKLIEFNKTESIGQMEIVKEQIFGQQKLLHAFEIKNDLDHQKMNQVTEQSMSKLSEDTRFLSQITELIRFFKNA